MFEGTWESLQTHRVPGWYDDAKLGIFIHWGLYSVPGWAPRVPDIQQLLIKDGPKRMLREAFKDDLTAWEFKRKKMGFAVPIGDWLRTTLKPMLHDLLLARNSLCAEHFRPSAISASIALNREFRCRAPSHR